MTRSKRLPRDHWRCPFWRCAKHDTDLVVVYLTHDRHLIKRIDTGGVSASSFFRAAFPTATEAQELAEMDWIARDSGNRYGDTRKAGAEHDETRRLSGTWSVFPPLCFCSLSRHCYLT